jgi:hypothetical protein
MITVFAAGLLLMAPVAGSARAEQLKQGAPPVEQQLASEGEFAISLGSALELTTTGDEVEAETALGNLGVAPRNGWIAEYPVTPDIVLELRNSVAAASDAGRLALGRNDALQRFDEVTDGFGLAVRPYTADTAYEPSAASCATYPNTAEVLESYTADGTPVVTYYCPPPDYYGLYTWVPSPFWWSDLWFPGFFILRDFNRVVHHHNRVVVIRNHFNDDRHHRAYRIDPADRYRGKTFGGIGAPRSKDRITTGVPREQRTIFNAPRTGRPADGGTVSNPSRGSERTAPVMRQERVSPPSGGGAVIRSDGGERGSSRSGGGEGIRSGGGGGGGGGRPSGGGGGGGRSYGGGGGGGRSFEGGRGR